MPRILAYTSPAAGHLFPLTPILDKLADRGHQVTVRTLAAQVPLSTAAKTGSWPQCQGQRRRPAFPSLRLLPDVCRSRGPCMGEPVAQTACLRSLAAGIWDHGACRRTSFARSGISSF